MNKFLAPDVQELVEVMEPAEDAADAVKSNSYREIRAYLESCEWCIPVDMTSFCWVHKCMCPAHPGAALAAMISKKRCGAPRFHFGEYGGEAHEFPDGKTPWWHADVSDMFPALQGDVPGERDR
eukprot:2924526-Karenia_brevis.AAC.1